MSRWIAAGIHLSISMTIGLLVLALLFLVKFLAAEEQGGTGITPAEVGQIFPYSLLVNVLGLASGFVVGRWLRFKTATQVTLGVEVGIQNSSLVFLIASTLIGNEDMIKPALVYAMFTFFTAVIYGLLLMPHQTGRLWRELLQTVGLRRKKQAPPERE